VKETLIKSFYKHSYLVIVAVWLFILSFLFSTTWSFKTSPASIQEKFERYIVNGERTFDRFAKDTLAISVLLNPNAVATDVQKYQSGETGLFVYTPNDVGNLLLTFWSNNKVSPQPNDLTRPDGKYLVVHSNGEFEFIKRTTRVKGHQVVLAGMIPIRWNYFINNKYLATNFPALGNTVKKYELEEQGGSIKVKNGDGKVLFGLDEKQTIRKSHPGTLSLVCKILAIAFVLAFFNMLAFDLSLAKGWLKGFLFLAAIIFFIRFLSYQFDFPFNYRGFELFDPAIYASNLVHPSLGDLLINIILLFWLITFVKYTGIPQMKGPQVYTGRKAFIITVSLSVLLVILSFAAAGIIRSLIIDSKISYDVANFFRLTIYTLISFIVLCFVTLSFFNISHVLLLHIYKCADVPPYVKYLAVAVTGLLYLTFNLKSMAMESNMVVLLWLLLYLFIINFRRSDLLVPLIRSSFFLPWLIFFAASISALIIYQSRDVQLVERKSYAEKLAMQSEPSSQNILNIGLSNFNNDAFLVSNFYRFHYEFANKMLKDSLINQNFQGFLNKYDTRIYTFDNKYKPLYNEDSIPYELVTNLMTNQSKKTSIPGVFYFENAYNRFSYLFHREIKNQNDSTLGYFFVVADPKKYKSDALFPELFKEVRDNAADADINNAYAIYSNGQITVNFGDYNFVSIVPRNQFPKQDFVEKIRNGFSELWYNAGNSKLIILVKPDTVSYQAVTLFAYLFGTFLFLIVMFHAAQFFIKTRFRWNRIVSSMRLNIRSQIQSTIIFISLFSFIVIGAATISFYISRFRKTNRERLVKAINIMANEVKSQIVTHAMFDDGIKLYDLGPRNQLERSINEISEIHSIDVNFYDLAGNLIISTQPYIYRKQILSGMMEPEAFYHLHYNNEIQYIHQENVGAFSFLSIYVPIRDESGQPYAYLNIPYLNSQAELNQEISNFLVTLINLNAFIFVFAGAIALLLTNRITRSFSLIGSKMKEINLGKAMEEIEWNSNDEIGALVNEYNKMVKKLEESAQALAKSEREGAWREMARQVAHEIKNPLTPMKLSIQYLQRSIEEKNPDIQMLSQKVAATLVEQIDQLAKIASDFSQFANIGHGKVEKFNVSDVLASLINLYSANEKLLINWKKPNRACTIEADRTQINRLFTNLFQNAIEASTENEQIEIDIEQKIEGNKLSISVTDHGGGIPEEKRDRIFTPNFTTKSSGTGLGLAICKGIVEKANGKIWFETEEGKGTTFYILLPLVGLPA
jgi:two-component system nitrogen regulation sensor histidine kinase NtrY